MNNRAEAVASTIYFIATALAGIANYQIDSTRANFFRSLQPAYVLAMFWRVRAARHCQPFRTQQANSDIFAGG